MASVRRKSFGRPMASITYTSATIANVNETTSPTITPAGRRRPPVTPAESTAGNTGSTHGESAVPAPATNANPIRRTTSASLSASA